MYQGALAAVPTRMPIRDAADALQMSVDTVRRRLRRGDLKGEFVDGKWIVEIEDSVTDGIATGMHPISQLAMRMIAQEVEHLRAENTRLTGIIEQLIERDPAKRSFLDKFKDPRP